MPPNTGAERDFERRLEIAEMFGELDGRERHEEAIAIQYERRLARKRESAEWAKRSPAYRRELAAYHRARYARLKATDPSFLERRRAWAKAAYRDRPEVREKKLEEARAYRESPEGSAKRAAYRQRPDVRERRAELARGYGAKPAAKAARRARYATDARVRARAQAFRQRPEAKARKNAAARAKYAANPGPVRAAAAAYRAANLEVVNARERERRSANRAAVRARAQANHAANREARNTRRRELYAQAKAAAGYSPG